jgi:hypothetical protein
MNSVVLRTALLNSKEFLEKYLKVKIVDVKASLPIPVEVKPKIEQKSKTKTKGDKTLEWK